MTQNKNSIFTQILSLIPVNKFLKFVDRHQSDKHSKGVLHLDALVAMMFLHLSPASSLREIHKGLKAISLPDQLGGLPIKVLSPSTLSYVNEKRSWKVYQDLFFELYRTLCPDLISKRAKELLGIGKAIFSLDSTTISLCQSQFEWAGFRKNKSGIKLHTLLNNDTQQPELIINTEAKASDLTVARENLSSLPTDSILVIDRGYLSYDFFHQLDSSGITFVTRLKANSKYEVLQETIEKERGEDRRWKQYAIRLEAGTSEGAEEPVYRVVEWKDLGTERRFKFITNDLTLSPEEVACLYKSRWDVELLFKRLKSNLNLKAFVGRSENAVMTQIWTGLIALILMEMLMLRVEGKHRLKNFLAQIRGAIFSSLSIEKLFCPDPPAEVPKHRQRQLE